MFWGNFPLSTIVFAIAGGVLPTFIWLRFWLREDGVRKEPRGLIVLSFIGGMLCVMLVIPLENWIASIAINERQLTLGAAIVEEFAKLLAFLLIAFQTYYIDESTDFPLYLITVGLGFAALENTIFLLEPILQRDIAITFFTGNLRFLGATVLHVIASGLLGVAMGLAFQTTRRSMIIHTFIGLILATVLHALFNFFIITSSSENIITIFGVVWVLAIILLFMFEKLRQHDQAPHARHLSSISL